MSQTGFHGKRHSPALHRRAPTAGSALASNLVGSRSTHLIRPLSTRARIGLLPAGHHYYWEQCPRLKQMGLGMHGKLRSLLESMADIVAPELVDTPEKSRAAGALFAQEAVDVLVFPFGYTPSMDMSRHQR